ncbi:hypothetical protein MTO96_037713, partial [Rhipicephalus appendiculatus]
MSEADFPALGLHTVHYSQAAGGPSTAPAPVWKTSSALTQRHDTDQLARTVHGIGFTLVGGVRVRCKGSKPWWTWDSLPSPIFRGTSVPSRGNTEGRPVQPMIPGRGASTTCDRRTRKDSQERENALVVHSSVGEEEASAGEAAVPQAVCQRGNSEWKLVQSKKRRRKAAALHKQERSCELCADSEGKVLAVTAAKSFRSTSPMTAVLCEKHFAPTDFVRTATYTDAQTGKVIEVPLERVRLKETAVPSVFANCPKYMSCPTPSAREAPEEKKVRLEAASLRAAIELSVAAQEEENRKNKVGSFEEFSVSDFWSVIIKESKVVFLDLALQRAPAVRSSVAVSVDLCIDVFIGEARIENLPSVNVPSHLQDLRQLNEVLQSVEQLHVSHSSDDNQKAHRLLKIVLMLLEDVC